MTYHDPRIDLQALRAEDLYAIASNEAAVHRELALRILVERGSLFAVKDDLFAAAQELILDNPIILKKVDPAAAITAMKLPGLIDCLADAQLKRQALARVVDQNNAAHAQSIADLGSAVIANQDTSERSLHTAAINLWRYILQQAWQAAEDAAAQKKWIAELQEEHARDTQAAAERLALLERSAWKKLTDWCKARWSRLRKTKADPTPTGQEEPADFEERVADMIRRA